LLSGVVVKETRAFLLTLKHERDQT
jgi:hypothetical protein